MTNTIVFGTSYKNRLRKFEPFFSTSNYTTHVANTGQETVKTAAQTVPDVLIVDTKMDGWSGVKVSKYLTEVYGVDAPTVLTHEPGSAQRARIGLSNGVDEVAERPLDKSKLLQTVEQLLKQNRNVHHLGEYRATFIDSTKGREHKTDSDTVRLLPSFNNGIGVPISQVPSWTSEGVEIVVGDSGNLISSFTARCIIEKKNVVDSGRFSGGVKRDGTGLAWFFPDRDVEFPRYW